MVNQLAKPWPIENRETHKKQTDRRNGLVKRESEIGASQL